MDKQGSCIQVNLGKEAEVRHRSEIQGSESGAVLTGFVTRPQPSLSVGVPGKRNRDTPHKLFITWWVVEGGRENWLWTAVCHVQMYGECYCHNKIQSGQSPPDSVLSLNWAPTQGHIKELCPPNSIKSHVKEASKRNSPRDSKKLMHL